MHQWSKYTQRMMRAASVSVVMGNAAMLLASCAAAYPGSGGTAEQRRYDITSCNNLASHPQPELPPMTAEQCLAMLGYTVKSPDGTIVAPPQLVLPYQPQRHDEIAPATVMPPVPTATSPTPVADTPVAGASYGLSDLRAIVGAYNGNRPKFQRLYAGQSFGFDSFIFGKKEMDDISLGYFVTFNISKDPNAILTPLLLGGVIACIAINDEATIDRVNGWIEATPTPRIRVVGTIADAEGVGLRLSDCTMKGP